MLDDPPLGTDPARCSDHFLERLSELYSRPVRWFLTLEDGDLGPENEPYSRVVGRPPEAPAPKESTITGVNSVIAGRVQRKIAEAPADYAPLLEMVVDSILEGLRRTKS